MEWQQNELESEIIFETTKSSTKLREHIFLSWIQAKYDGNKIFQRYIAVEGNIFGMYRSQIGLDLNFENEYHCLFSIFYDFIAAN